MQRPVWGLERNPFPSGLDPERFHEGANQQEALARLRYLVDHHRRLGVISGETGVGKSLLLRMFAEERCQTGHAVAQAQLMGLSVRELHWQLAAQLRAAPRSSDDVLKLWQRLESRIAENHLQAISTVLLLDDADQAGADVQAQLMRIAQNPAFSHQHLTIVLSANPCRGPGLGNRLTELLELRIELEPWQEADTVGYVQFALLAAGADRPLFEDEALVELHRLSRGVPRRVNRLAEYTLLIGASLGLPMIDVATVREAHESLHHEAVRV